MASRPFEPGGRILAFEDFGVDPFGLDAGAVGHAAVGQAFDDGFVGVFQLGVLADDADADLVFGVGQPVHHVGPSGSRLGFGAGVMPKASRTAWSRPARW